MRPDQAVAFKPYTHNWAGDNAYADAVDNCAVTIEDRDYNLHPKLCEALRLKRGHYNAGVVGPDGYPDVIMGQGVVHPEDTGKWLKHVLDKAWDAEGDPNVTGYGEQEQLEILAFSYGFLTHAAGDMWAHTLVNDFAQGVFPSVTDIPSDPELAKIAFRHIIIEGYIGDATPGYDGNPARAQLPGHTNEDGDPEYSDDSTPGIVYAVPPGKFIWDSFVGRNADANGHLTLALDGQPTAARGELIEFFYDLRNDLYDEAGSFTTLDSAIAGLNALLAQYAEFTTACSNPISLDCLEWLVDTVYDTATEFLDAFTIAHQAAVELIIDAYMWQWIEDIEEGLKNWSNVGNAFTRGLFDPAAYREYQNEKCDQEEGDDVVEGPRATCEDSVDPLDTFLDVLGESWTTDEPHLLSMLGAPDIVGVAAEVVDQVEDFIDSLIDFPNPLAAAQEALRQEIENRIKQMIKDTLGVDVDQLKEMLENPASMLDAALPSPPFPPGIILFNFGDHERLDEMLGLPDPGPLGEHHTSGNRLEDDVEFSLDNFAPMKNTIVTSKLLLLGGDELNRALSDILGRKIESYGTGMRNNFMVDSLGGLPDPWLRSIDSDHAWRQDGLPVFCDDGMSQGDCDQFARTSDPHYNRSKDLRGGTGKMPVWESCVLRPAFAALFDDWENGDQQFPALGDRVSSDLASDNAAPRSYLMQVPGTAFYPHPNGRNFVGGDNAFTISAHDDVTPNKGFADSELGIRYRVTPPGGAIGPWLSATQGQQLSIGGSGDGKYVIDVEAEDPCHTFATDDVGNGGPTASFEYWLDTTPPKLTCGEPPYNQDWITDQFATADWTLDDGPDGSGVDESETSAQVDGYVTVDGTDDVTVGYVYDMYLFYPGTRTTSVTASDNIGNTATNPCTFYLYATPDSLIKNLNRAKAEGDVPLNDVYTGGMDKLIQIKRQHEKAKHETEWNVLDAYAELMEGQRGHGIDLDVANRFIAYSLERIALRR